MTIDKGLPREPSKVSVYAAPSLFVCFADGKDVMREGCIAFGTRDFFAALGHGEAPQAVPYKGAEVYSSAGNPVGRIISSSSEGIYGAFYEEGEEPLCVQNATLSFFSHLEIGKAELVIPIDGKVERFNGRIVALFEGKPHPVLFEVCDESFPGAGFGSSGSVIMQNGKIAAVVAGANEYPSKLLYCTSAEQMVSGINKAMDLFYEKE